MPAFVGSFQVMAAKLGDDSGVMGRRALGASIRSIGKSASVPARARIDVPSLTVRNADRRHRSRGIVCCKTRL